jgi:hypothetical protein
MKWRRAIRDHALLAIFSVILLVACVVLYRGYRACEAQGGKYVRGLLTMECIR